MIPYPYCNAGQAARITAGPLAGIEGIVVTKNARCDWFSP